MSGACESSGRYRESTLARTREEVTAHHCKISLIFPVDLALILLSYISMSVCIKEQQLGEEEISWISVLRSSSIVNN